MERASLKDKPSLIFIGMPASGKTTIGSLVSEMLSLPFVDFDALIEERCGMSVAEVFAHRGERFFRDMEHDICAELSGVSGYVISPGGGIVEKEQNMEYLKKNSVICRLYRDLSLIDTRGRPLLQKKGAVEEIWKRRAPLYDKYATFTVMNNQTPEWCAENVVKQYLSEVL